MKLLVCVIAVIVASTKGDENCSIYFKQITAEYEQCLSSNIDVTQVVSQLAEVANGEVTVEEYQKTVSNFCSNFNNVPDCFDSLTVEKSACYYDPPFQDFRNGFKSFIILNKFGCANNGKRYLNMVDGDGPKCYTQNKENYNCFNNLKSKHGVKNNEAFQDNSICKTKLADAECLSAYDGCTNRNVKVFLTELNEAVQKAFKCN